VYGTPSLVSAAVHAAVIGSDDPSPISNTFRFSVVVDVVDPADRAPAAAFPAAESVAAEAADPVPAAAIPAAESIAARPRPSHLTPRRLRAAKEFPTELPHPSSRPTWCNTTPNRTETLRNTKDYNRGFVRPK
jgi:hypothetical protein